MAAMIKYFLTILLFSFVSRGCCRCSFKDIVINVVRSDKVIQGKTEWNVAVVNNCKCTQSGITLFCPGFESVEAVDPKIIIRADNRCLVNQGRPLAPFSSIKFTYAWDPSISFRPRDSVVTC